MGSSDAVRRPHRSVSPLGMKQVLAIARVCAISARRSGSSGSAAVPYWHSSAGPHPESVRGPSLYSPDTHRRTSAKFAEVRRCVSGGDTVRQRSDRLQPSRVALPSGLANRELAASFSGVGAGEHGLIGRGARQRRPWIDIAPELGEWIDAQQSIEPTGGSRFCRSAFLSQRRLPPVAHARRWAL